MTYLLTSWRICWSHDVLVNHSPSGSVLDFWSLGRWFEPTHGHVSSLISVIAPGVCLAQISLSNVHKRGLKHHHFISTLNINGKQFKVFKLPKNAPFRLHVLFGLLEFNVSLSQVYIYKPQDLHSRKYIISIIFACSRPNVIYDVMKYFWCNLTSLCTCDIIMYF